MFPIDVFEAERPHLIAVAFRLLGSVHDAEDAVQAAWIKARTAPTDGVRNPGAWLTTVVTRICLDQLRGRARRREDTYDGDSLRTLAADVIAADEDYIRREDVSRALMVLLHRLTPAQRVAYVLHDLFGVPFSEIATTMGTSPAGAKKHASRARERIASATPPSGTDSADALVVEAFLSAAAGGDIDRMLALMTEDCVRIADPALVPPDVPATVAGARAVAEETGRFAGRIRARTRVLVDGRTTHVLAPGGHPMASVRLDVRAGLIARIEIAAA